MQKANETFIYGIVINILNGIQELFWKLAFFEKHPGVPIDFHSDHPDAAGAD